VLTVEHTRTPTSPLHFSNVRPTNALLTEALSLTTSRAAANHFRFLVRHRSLHPSDGVLEVIIHHLARCCDFLVVHTLIQEFPTALRPATLRCLPPQSH
jgi:hypothetical protein